MSPGEGQVALSAGCRQPELEQWCCSPFGRRSDSVGARGRPGLPWGLNTQIDRIICPDKWSPCGKMSPPSPGRMCPSRRAPPGTRTAGTRTPGTWTTAGREAWWGGTGEHRLMPRPELCLELTQWLHLCLRLIIYYLYLLLFALLLVIHPPAKQTKGRSKWT